MSAKILQFRPRPVTVDLDQTTEGYTVEELVERERQIGNGDGRSAQRRALVEKLLEAAGR